MVDGFILRMHMRFEGASGRFRSNPEGLQTLDQRIIITNLNHQYGFEQPVPMFCHCATSPVFSFRLPLS
jgi:hypothetical protein